MEVSELLEQLAKLQLEQDKIIQQLVIKTGGTEAEPTDNTGISVGDHVVLLTGGVRCTKGDRARVTKVTRSAVHFTVLRNQHSTHKQHRNVGKVS